MTHVMLDLETMALAPNAAIVAIGAVQMDEQGRELSSYYCSVSLESSVMAGLTMDPGTVMWWMSQADNARQRLTENSKHLNVALQGFANWIPKDLVGFWGNGAAADNVWLAEAYRATGLCRPWNHKQDRCYRTFRAMHRDVGDLPENEAAHDALADAQWQADFMRRVCEQKGLTLK